MEEYWPCEIRHLPFLASHDRLPIKLILLLPSHQSIVDVSNGAIVSDRFFISLEERGISSLLELLIGAFSNSCHFVPYVFHCR